MTGQRKDRKMTAPTRQEFVEAFYREWYFSEGRPSYLAAAILFAQYAFETGWGKFCFNWNLGNVRAFHQYIEAGGDYFELPGAWEIVDGKRVVAGGFFRSHADLDDGMRAHLTFLSGLDRYGPAFDVLVEAANTPFTKESATFLARKFVRALKAGGYFTGDLSDYENGVASIVLGIFDLKLVVDEMPAPSHEPASILTPDNEFLGFGATTVQDIFGRWVYDECMTADLLACRWDNGVAA